MILAVLLSAAGACVPLEHSRITGADLARADTAFSAVPPDTTLGYAPAFGVRRVFRGGELAALASRFGISRQPDAAVCFEWAAERLTPERVLPVMHAALGRENLTIDILDLYRGPVPKGRIVFPAFAPAAPSGTKSGAVWRGHIVYGNLQKFGVWVRVLIHGPMLQVIATADLKAGVPIAKGSIAQESRDADLRPGATAQSLGEVLGRIPLRTIPAGSAVRLDALRLPADVRPGEVVDVEARCGAARIRMDALAESEGRRGQLVTLRNPSNGRTFKGRVEEKGKVSIEGGGCR